MVCGAFALFCLSVVRYFGDMSYCSTTITGETPFAVQLNNNNKIYYPELAQEASSGLSNNGFGSTSPPKKKGGNIVNKQREIIRPLARTLPPLRHTITVPRARLPMQPDSDHSHCFRQF
jgi:hypothetical protein